MLGRNSEWGVFGFGVDTAPQESSAGKQSRLEALSILLKEGVRFLRREGWREGVERAFWCVMVVYEIAMEEVFGL